MIFVMHDEQGRLIGAGVNGQTLAKSIQNFKPLAKVSPPPERRVPIPQKPKMPDKAHPWRHKEDKPSRLEDLVKSLSALARGEPLKSSDDFRPGKPLRKSFGPTENMGELLRKIPNAEYRQPHYVRMMLDAGVL